MATASSPVDVCNMTCSRLGQAPIRALDINPMSDVEQLFAREYDPARQYCLSLNTWSFARKRVILTAQTDPPEFDFESAYELPSDFIRLVSIGGDNEFLREDWYDIEGDLLLTMGDDATLKVRYIYDHTDVKQWSKLFTEMVVLQLGIACGYQLTKKNNVVERCERQFERAAAAAATKQGQDKKPERIQRSPILEARRRIVGGYRNDPSRVID